MRTRTQRGSGSGCLLWLIVICIALGFLISTCSSSDDDSDCYTTGEPGSAQEQRDIQRCLGQ